MIATMSLAVLVMAAADKPVNPDAYSYDQGVYGSGIDYDNYSFGDAPQYDNTFTNSPVETIGKCK